MTTQQLAQRHQARLEAMCASYGITQTSPIYQSCLMQADSILRQEDAQRAAAMVSLGAALLPQSGPQYYALPPMTMQCTQMGVFTNCAGSP